MVMLVGGTKVPDYYEPVGEWILVVTYMDPTIICEHIDMSHSLVTIFSEENISIFRMVSIIDDFIYKPYVMMKNRLN